MALPVNLTRAAYYSIRSTGAVPEDFYYINATTGLRELNTSGFLVPWERVPYLATHFIEYHHTVSKVGFDLGAMGLDWPVFAVAVVPTLLWFAGIMLVRYLCRNPLATFGLYMGVVTENNAAHRRRLADGKRGVWALSRHNRQKLFKFQNQLWLTVFYITSTYFGYRVQRDKPWFRLPMNAENALHMVLPHPYNPPREIVVYYEYSFGFYLAELFSLIFLEKDVKRADFIEYVLHHFITLALIFISFGGYYHRFGAYVLIIHDASDICLSLAKSLHYMINEDEEREKRFNKLHLETLKDGQTYKKHFLFKYIVTENLANVLFALFILFFFFFRLYCLPSIALATFGTRVNFIMGNWAILIVSSLLQIALQMLHLYWAYLIVVMVVKIFICGGERKDIRSDDDENENEPPSVVMWGDRITDTDSEVKTSRENRKKKQ